MDELTRLVSTGDSVKIWDAVSMAPLEQFNPHSSTHPLAQACWSSNNQYMMTSSSSGDKLVLSSLKSSPVSVLELADGRKQTRVCLSSSSQFLVSGGLDQCVHIWDLKTARLHRSLKDHKEEVTCVSFNANDNYVASGSTSGDLVLHSLTTNLSSKPFGHGSDQPIHDLHLSVVKRSLLGSVSDSGTVVLWDANTQKELHVFDAAHKAPGSGLVFSPSSNLLVVSVGLDKKIVCYDTASKIVLRSIRVDSPLTSVDFTPDGTGVVVGSTRGKIYQYDLRNSSAPTRITIAHKTSVTCLRFQNSSRTKTSKLSRISSMKKSSNKLSDSHPDPVPSPDPSSQRQGTLTGGAAVDVTSWEAEGPQGAELLPAMDKFSNVGRNSLDIFSPAREDSRAQLLAGEAPYGRGNVTSLETLHRDMEGQQPIGRRPSLDIFSPLRDDSYSEGTSQRKTPLGTPLSSFAVPCLTPLTIREEEPSRAATDESCDYSKTGSPDKQRSCSQEADSQTAAQPANQSPMAAPFFTPEPSLRRANGFQALLSKDSPLQGAPPTSSAGAALTSAVSSSLSQSIVDVVGQGAAAPLTSLQVHFIQNMIQETLDEFRTTCHQDIINLQVEMVRQFYIQLMEIHGLIEKYSVNESLVEEIERLKEENKRLKTNY